MGASYPGVDQCPQRTITSRVVHYSGVSHALGFFLNTLLENTMFCISVQDLEREKRLCLQKLGTPLDWLQTYIEVRHWRKDAKWAQYIYTYKREPECVTQLSSRYSPGCFPLPSLPVLPHHYRIRSTYTAHSVVTH